MSAPLPPAPSGPIPAPTWRALLQETRFAWEWWQTRRQAETLLNGLPNGAHTPVMLLPGYNADERAMKPLFHRLSDLGYQVRHWGQGKNHGAVHKLLPPLQAHLKSWSAETGQPITLVGWSLGGYIARELARDCPDVVGGVVTLGSPAIGGPKYTITAASYRKKGFDLDAIEAQIATRDRLPITCPLTVLYSRRDGIVSWPAMIDRVTPQAQHIEVFCTHLGLVYDGPTFRTLAHALADQRRPG